MKTKIKNNFNIYKNEYLISFLFFIGIYLFKIFMFSYSLDTEYYLVNKEAILLSWLNINRFSLVLLKELFSFIPFNIFLTNLLTVILFYIATMLTYVNLCKISKKYQSSSKMMLFSCAMGSSPIMLEQFNFTLQSKEMAFFLLLFELSFYYFLTYMEGKQKKWIVLSILLLAITFGAYQSFAVLFITMVFIYLYQEFVNHPKDKRWPKMITSVLIFGFAFILYIGISKIAMNLFKMHDSSYLYNQISWLNQPFLTNIKNIKNSFISVYFGFFYHEYLFSLLNTFCFLILVYHLFKSVRDKKYIQIFYTLLLIISPLLLTIVLGGQEPIRAHFVTPLILAYTLIEFYSNKKIYTIISWGMILIQVITMFYFEVNDYKRFQYDKQMAFDIYEIIKDKIENKKLIFIGSIDSYPKDSMIKGESLDISFFNAYGMSDRAPSFMKSLGYPINSGSMEDIEKCKLLAKDLKVYPDQESILITDAYVIIKLSNTL